MLGRLEMSVDECIQVYEQMSRQVFEKHFWFIPGWVVPTFDSHRLECAVKAIVEACGESPDALIQLSDDEPCKV